MSESHHAPKPRKQWMPIEKLALRAILYAQAALTIVVCIVLAWLVIRYNLLPNVFERVIAILILLGIVFFYVPRSLKDVYAEVKRRGG